MGSWVGTPGRPGRPGNPGLVAQLGLAVESRDPAPRAEQQLRFLLAEPTPT